MLVQGSARCEHEVEMKPEVTISSAELDSGTFESCPGRLRQLPENENQNLGKLGQGRAAPNAQAALLIRLVEKYPDTVSRLAAV